MFYFPSQVFSISIIVQSERNPVSLEKVEKIKFRLIRSSEAKYSRQRKQNTKCLFQKEITMNASQIFKSCMSGSYNKFIFHIKYITTSNHFCQSVKKNKLRQV